MYGVRLAGLSYTVSSGGCEQARCPFMTCYAASKRLLFLRSEVRLGCFISSPCCLYPSHDTSLMISFGTGIECIRSRVK